LVTAYQALRQPRHEKLRVRGLEMHLTRWGPEPTIYAPPVFMLHGWLDAGDTFQFMVDALQKDWPIVAPDWRGFGRSEWPQEGYGFPDYLGDFDALLDQLSLGQPARIVGHSMGGNIANLYAGLRPERVRCVVNIEGFGLPRTTSAESPKRMRKWLDQIKGLRVLRPIHGGDPASISALSGGCRGVRGACVGCRGSRAARAAGGGPEASLGEPDSL
jgi:pimeloyl-ACP methyl ester carboxylesterase